MQRSLVYQIYPLYVLVVVAAIGVVIGVAAKTARDMVLRQAALELEREISLVTAALESNPDLDREALIAFCERSTEAVAMHVSVYGPDGALVCSSADSPRRGAAPVPPEERPQASDPGYRDETAFVARVIRSGGLGPVTVRLVQSRDEVNRGLSDLGATILVSGIVVVIATALISLRFMQRITYPLRNVQRAAERFAHGHLGYRFEVDGPQEIQDVATTLNSMAEQLQGTIDRISSQRNELEAILSAMVEGVMVLDTGFRIRSMNQAAANLFQQSHDEGRGKTVIEFTRNFEIAQFAEEALASDAPIERTLTIYKQEVVHLQMHGTVLGSTEERKTGVLIVMNDVTRLKRLENLRRDFVANVSHELKTPITSILGFVETLTEGGLRDTERAEHFINIIHHHTTRLNAIIEDLLSLSRLESHESEIPFEYCSVDEIVWKITEAYAETAAQHEVTIHTHYREGLRIRANANLLEQAISNLVNNAVKYSEAGSTVDVTIERHSGRVSVSVQDTGYGIPEDDLPRIFERFYRVDRARSRQLGGTGLGLAIVKHIARAHGGEVSVESTLGRGSTFTISIPQGR
jgi:two-component system phosphate regulon sensor histidine kinase PhoR